MDDLFSFANNNESHSETMRIIELTAQLNHHNNLYYQEAAPEISDAEFDSLLDELKKLEAKYPDQIAPDSPTQRVGGAALDGFQQRQHLVPMLSIEDIHELKDEELAILHETSPDATRANNLIHWFKRFQRNLGHDDVALTLEPKIDGVAVSLVYRNRVLDYAVTRGDGTTGDDITQNIKTIKTIPLRLPDSAPDLFEVRGEVFMPNTAFAELNQQRDDDGEPAFVNPRNAASGTLKQLDSKIVATRPLDCIFHSYGQVENPPYTTLTEFQSTLTEFGLPATHWFKKPTSMDELMDCIAQLDQDRHSFPYATDGAVIKVNDLTLHAQLGATSKFPKWACAYKFRPVQAETILHNITIQVGRTGVLTPVAELNPVFVSGSTVSRATLHNQDEITRKDIRIGDTVVIEKAGEIIPSVVKVIIEKRPANSTAFNLFQYVDGKCPSCSAPISREEGFVAWKCTNFTCPAQAVSKLTYFASRKALDIEGLDDALAKKLIQDDLIKSPLDIFSLTEEKLANIQLDPAKSSEGFDISTTRRFGQKRSITLLRSLENAKSKPLHRWLIALGVKELGETTARDISKFHKTFDDIINSEWLLSVIRLQELYDQRILLNPKGHANKAKSSDEKKSLKILFESNFYNCNELLEKLASRGVISKNINKERKPDEDLILDNYPRYSSQIQPLAAKNLIDFLQTEQGIETLTCMKNLSIFPQSDNFYNPSDQSRESLLFINKTFVITGTLSQPRPELQKIIEANGGKVSDSISKNTDFLLCGEKAGSKRDKAERLGVKILDETEFRNMII